MSTAMELMVDHDVEVVERRPIAGGKARTWTDPEFNVFREHSFRVFHGSYHNTFDTMQRVSVGENRTIRDYLVPFTTKEDIEATGTPLLKRWIASTQGDVPVTFLEWARIAWDTVRLLGALTACDERLEDRYGNRTFEEIFLSRPGGGRGLLFQGLKDMSQVEYSADRVNPDVKVMLNFIEKHFLHGLPGLAWNALVGPTSDTFIEPWKQHLVGRGVTFRHDTEVVAINYDPEANRVTSVTTRDRNTGAEEDLFADYVVSALPSDDLLSLVSRDLLRSAPSVARLEEMRRVWNNGVILYTSKKTRFLGGYYMWHPWRVAVTTYADRWTSEFDLSRYGVGATQGAIKDIISYVITDWHTPGKRVRKNAADCTPEEIYKELTWMSLEDPTILPEFSLTDLVHPTNRDGKAVSCMVDGSLVTDPDTGRITRNEDTLLHLPPGASFRMPGARTEISNFILSSTHCYNVFGCGDSMEGANETGRRAANAVLAAEGNRRRVPILEGRTSSLAVRALVALRQVDEILYKFAAPARSRASLRTPGAR
jgi:uncharacterized protein with NAD-binding domain and iron-sulfur cluster